MKRSNDEHIDNINNNNKKINTGREKIVVNMRKFFKNFFLSRSYVKREKAKKIINYYAEEEKLNIARAFYHYYECFDYSKLKKFLKMFLEESKEIKEYEEMIGYAEYLMASIYKRNIKKSNKHYHLAIEKNCPVAMVEMSKRYISGQGVDRDDGKALDLLNKAANLGSSQAYVILAGYYKKGCLVDIDDNTSLSYFKKAAEIGNEPVIKYLARYHGLTGNPEDLIISLYYYKKLIKIIDIRKKSASRVKERLEELIKINQFEWTPRCHRYWTTTRKKYLNKTLIVLLLISKFRKETSHTKSSVFVKVIIFTIAKFFCQIVKEEEDDHLFVWYNDQMNK